jgi:hypothetical protein
VPGHVGGHVDEYRRDLGHARYARVEVGRQRVEERRRLELGEGL